MSYSSFSQPVSRLFRKRDVRGQLRRVSDPRRARGRRWPFLQVLETVVGALVLQICSCHQLDERTRMGPPRRVGELRLAPIPDATLPWILPQVDRREVREVLVESVRAEVRRKRVVTPEGAIRTLGAEEHERGAFAAFWEELLDTYGRLPLFEVVTLDAGYASLRNATLIDTAGYGYVLGLKANQPELVREAQRVLQPLAASQPPAAQVLDRDHGLWVRRSLWRTAECAGWLEWHHLWQVWLVRTEKFVRQTTPRTDSVPVEVEDHYYVTNLRWNHLEGVGIFGVVRSHWGIENNGFRTLDIEWHEEQAWCTKGAATDVLGLLRVWAHNLVGLLKGRYLRAVRYRRLTLTGFVPWLEQMSVWGEARRRSR